MPKQKKTRVSTIPLSLRGKKRYILFHVRSPHPIPKSDFEPALHQHLIACYGTLGLPEHRARLVAFDSPSGNGILRCAHTSRDALILALTSFSLLKGQPLVVRTKRTSGTIKSLRPLFARDA